MENHYKSALDKIKLSEVQKNRAKRLFYGEKEERRNVMRAKSLFKGVAATAAGLAIVIAANAVIPIAQNNHGGASDHSVVSDVNRILASVADNYFTVTAYAKELTETGKVYPNDAVSLSYALCGDEKDGISFAFEFPVECKGENIDTITYAIREGAFQVSSEKGKSVVIDGEKVEKELNVPGIEAGAVEEGKGEWLQYKSFTVDYDTQTNEKTRINVVDTSDVWSREKFAEYKKMEYDIVGSSIEQKKEVCDFLTKNLGITCTVKYKDGSTETKDIVVSNEVTKLSDVLGKKERGAKNEKIVAKYFSIR